MKRYQRATANPAHAMVNIVKRDLKRGRVNTPRTLKKQRPRDVDRHFWDGLRSTELSQIRVEPGTELHEIIVKSGLNPLTKIAYALPDMGEEELVEKLKLHRPAQHEIPWGIVGEMMCGDHLK